MKSKTTTREYDADGNMTKEVVTEYDDSGAQRPVCTCGWYGPASFGYCPVHGYRHGYGHGIITTTATSPTIMVNTTDSTVSHVVYPRNTAAALGR